MEPDSFIRVLEAFGNAHPPAMRYQQGQDFAQWQSDFRAKLDELRGPVPPRVELDVQTVETVEQDNHTRHLLSISVNDLWRLPAYLLVPHGIKAGEQRPGLLVSHGHGAPGMEEMSGVTGDDPRRHTAAKAVADGFVALAPAWWGWPGRDGHVERVRNRDKCNVIQGAASMYGISVLSLLIEDAQAAVDVLQSRPEVDPQRIGCLGNSYGGRTTMWFSLFDPRITASVASGSMNLLRERSLKLAGCAIQFLPGVLRYGDVAELFSLIAPRALQLQAGEGDKLITPEDRDHIEATARTAYRAAGAEQNLDYVLHDQGHVLDWPSARPFLQRHLGTPDQAVSAESEAAK